jgi:hypothetical protein
MSTESRKIHLIEEVLKVTDDATLYELETVLKNSTVEIKKKSSAHDFVGLWSKKDAVLIEKAIHEGCEQIHENDWK